MIRFCLISVILFFNLLSGYSIANSDNLKIGVITDVHFLSPELTDNGAAYDSYRQSTGRDINDLHEVLDFVIADLIDKDIDILLITGDLTNHGERQSHLDFIEKLKHVHNSGISVFVIPGNHDINIPDAKAYIGDKPSAVVSINKKDFSDFYSDFGYGNAIKRDNISLSYLAEINESTWLLSFDTNRYNENRTSSVTGGRILDQTMDWAIEILEEARSRGIRVIGMMHHGLVEHMPYQSAFFSDYLVDDWQERAEQLADAGLEIIFTGHFHSNDITLLTSPSGNRIYDIETASLAQYPFAYRVMQLDSNKLSIETHFITSVAGNPDLEQEYYKKLEGITKRVAQSRINNLGLPVPNEMKSALINIIVKLNLAHVKGDEQPDTEMLVAIKAFASMLGNEVDTEDYSLDFPPADNNLVIELNKLEVEE